MKIENTGEGEPQISINMEAVISRYLYPNSDDVEDFLQSHSKIIIHTLHPKFHSSSRFYDPECVSIGPIHHVDKKLQQKEKGKRNYGKLIIKRTTEKKRKDKLGVFHECITYVQ
ncbi:hypothetical protein MKW92_005154, partial [Papaver armeniacum]